MSTINDVDSSYLVKELKDIESKIEYYESLYKNGNIKCLTLNRLITIKKKEKEFIVLVLENRNLDGEK